MTDPLSESALCNALDTIATWQQAGADTPEVPIPDHVQQAMEAVRASHESLRAALSACERESDTARAARKNEPQFSLYCCEQLVAEIYKLGGSVRGWPKDAEPVSEQQAGPVMSAPMPHCAEEIHSLRVRLAACERDLRSAQDTVQRIGLRVLGSQHHASECEKARDLARAEVERLRGALQRLCDEIEKVHRVGCESLEEAGVALLGLMAMASRALSPSSPAAPSSAAPREVVEAEPHAALRVCVAALRACVEAMEAWGAQEDGIPDAGLNRGISAYLAWQRARAVLAAHVG